MTCVPLILNSDHPSLPPVPGTSSASPTIGLVAMLFPLHSVVFRPFLGWLMSSSLPSALHSVVPTLLSPVYCHFLRQACPVQVQRATTGPERTRTIGQSSREHCSGCLHVDVPPRVVQSSSPEVRRLSQKLGRADGGGEQVVHHRIVKE